MCHSEPECNCFQTRPSLWPCLAEIKISRWYLKRFKCYRVDKQTSAHQQTNTVEHNITFTMLSLHGWCWTQYHLHYAITARVMLNTISPSLCYHCTGDVAGPRLWNKLPASLRSSDSLCQFRRQLKTFLFVRLRRLMTLAFRHRI